MKRLGLTFLLLTNIIALFGQDITKVRGYVYDKQTGEALPFVNVLFKNSSVGTTTDLDGFFSIDTKFPTDSLSISFIGYNSQSQFVPRGERTELIFRMESKTLLLDDVTIIAKKGKYRKKGNPAVELMRKVIANKKSNRLEGQDYYSHDQYERIQLDLNNITEDFKDRRFFKKFDLLWEYLDTSNVNGKVYLPMYLQEIDSKVYYRKNP